MKTKAIFMGLIVLMCTGNQVHPGVQSAATGILNASWSTLEKQGAMVATGAAVLGGLAYYLLLAKNERISDSTVTKGNSHSSVEYIRCRDIFLRNIYYKIDTING